MNRPRSIAPTLIAAALVAGLGACQTQKSCCGGRDSADCCGAGSSCCASDAEKPTALRVTDLKQVEGAWTLVSVSGADVQAVRAAHPDRDVGMTIASDGTTSGLAGVNRFSTRLDLASTQMVFTPAISTKMAGPDDLMALELRFTAALGRARELLLRGDELTLMTSGEPLATFRRVK